MPRHRRRGEASSQQGSVNVGGMRAVYDLTTGGYRYVKRTGDPADTGERRPEDYTEAGTLGEEVERTHLGGAAYDMAEDPGADVDGPQPRGSKQRKTL